MKVGKDEVAVNVLELPCLPEFRVPALCIPYFASAVLLSKRALLVVVPRVSLGRR